MTKISKFQRGQSTYNCAICGKLTRDTGAGEGSLELCVKCFDERSGELSFRITPAASPVAAETAKAVIEST